MIEKNKFAHRGTHFESPHAILGLVTYVWMVCQAVVGATMFFAPALYGSDSNAKSVWKYHRASGYVLLVLALATVSAATQTFYAKTVLEIPLWGILVSSVLVLAGVLPRVKKQKLGL